MKHFAQPHALEGAALEIRLRAIEELANSVSSSMSRDYLENMLCDIGYEISQVIRDMQATAPARPVPDLAA